MFHARFHQFVRQNAVGQSSDCHLRISAFLTAKISTGIIHLVCTQIFPKNWMIRWVNLNHKVRIYTPNTIESYICVSIFLILSPVYVNTCISTRLVCYYASMY